MWNIFYFTKLRFLNFYISWIHSNTQYCTSLRRATIVHLVTPTLKFAVLSLWFNLLKPTGYVMHQQFNIQQLYVLPTLYLCVLYLSENKQRLVPLTP